MNIGIANRVHRQASDYKAMTKAFHRSSFTPGLGSDPRSIQRLSLSSASRRNRNTRWPSFDPRRLQPGIVHFGCGAFHRAHQNVFTQRAIELDRSSRSSWGVVGVNFRSTQTRQLLAPQDYLYTVLERGQDNTQAEVVGVLRGLLFARDQPSLVVARLADPQTRIVTLTVTPSGYLPPERTPNPAVDAIGLLVDGLAAVRNQGTTPPVLISCDNMPGNGRRLREAIVQRARSSSLAHWIARNVQCPSSVVDRIVPVPTPADCAAASGLLGLQDLATVATEPFCQWVMEDFEGPRPRWDEAGAKFVSDVSPWEASKLTLLNGTHMAIAFLGMLAQLGSVSDFMRDPLFYRYASRLMLDEQIPTIPKSDHDLVSYCHQLLERWLNRNIVHRLERIARNGAQKLQARLLTSLAENMAAGRPAPCTILAIAAWACCAARILPFASAVEDDAAHTLEELAAASRGDTRQFVHSLLRRQDIFGSELPQKPAFREELVQAIDCLKLLGARGAVSRLVSVPAGVLR
jgi:fructuronate reductase